MFKGVSIVPDINFRGATGDPERGILVSFVTLTPYLILVDNLSSNLSVMPNLSILSFSLSSLKSSKLLMIKLILALASLSLLTRKLNTLLTSQLSIRTQKC